jgi:hypothetical protein
VALSASALGPTASPSTAGNSAGFNKGVSVAKLMAWKRRRSDDDLDKFSRLFDVATYWQWRRRPEIVHM